MGKPMDPERFQMKDLKRRMVRAETELLRHGLTLKEYRDRLRALEEAHQAWVAALQAGE